jgi:hypothetical protein
MNLAATANVAAWDLSCVAAGKQSVYVRFELQTQQFDFWTVLLALQALEPIG